MQDDSYWSNQGTNEFEAWEYNKRSEENFYLQNSADKHEAEPSYNIFANFMEALDCLPELPVSFDHDIENKHSVANCIDEDTNNAYLKEFGNDALTTREEESTAKTDNLSNLITEHENEQHNTDTTVSMVPNTALGKEISNKSSDFKETPANNNRTVDIGTTEIFKLPHNLYRSIINDAKKWKGNEKIPQFNYNVEVEIRRNASNVEIEIKAVPKHNDLNEFLVFNNNSAAEEPKVNNNEENEEKATSPEPNVTSPVYTQIKHKCNLCDSEFAFKMDLIRHFANTHGHKCKECDFVADCPYKLKLHTRRHTGEKPYACHLCNDSFRRKDMLSRHYLSHTDIKPYICHSCNSRFKSLKNLKQHVKNNCAWFSCTHCPLRFTSVSDLDSHRDTHEESDYTCEVCGWRYKTRYWLNRHKNIHNTDAVAPL